MLFSKANYILQGNSNFNAEDGDDAEGMTASANIPEKVLEAFLTHSKDIPKSTVQEVYFNMAQMTMAEFISILNFTSKENQISNDTFIRVF